MLKVTSCGHAPLPEYDPFASIMETGEESGDINTRR